MINIEKLRAQKSEKLASVATFKNCSLQLHADSSIKAEGDSTSDLVAVINTSNWLDSHGDVHAKGIWDDSPMDGISYVLDHDFSVSGLIAQPSDVKVEVRRMRWKQLGLDINGTTDALVYNVDLKEYASPDFIRAYNNGVIMQNSVRMRYDELVLCVNNKDYGAEFEAWNKYIKEVANREDAEEMGYFWYIKKARIHLEGSAVLRGSNGITPMLTTKQENTGDEPITNKNEGKESLEKLEYSYSYYKTIH